jgi:class 3 adenylate cyclase
VRAELPTGTVTFLFTDVEGSTKLLQELGTETYSDALAEHQAIVRSALAAHRGVERTAVEEAMATGETDAFRRAVELARNHGYV